MERETDRQTERDNFQTVTALLNILAAYSLFALKLKKKKKKAAQIELTSI